ncbi:hypothetical protein ACHAWF_001546 [Thalassiosira exigua]
MMEMEDASSGESGGGVKERCGETTEAEEADEDENGDEEDATVDDPVEESLVVLKCLKPVSERKVRRELLVLTHCRTLPNVARLKGIVLPDAMDDDDDDEEEGNAEGEEGKRGGKAHHRRRRRHHPRKVQSENIGSITDAASVERARDKKAPAGTRSKDDGGGEFDDRGGTQLPALVLEHAGRNCQWFCHGQREGQTPSARRSPQQGAGGCLTEYEIKYYLCHLFVALDALHEAGIMHRDVKPRNTLINRDVVPDLLGDGGADGAADVDPEGERLSTYLYSPSARDRLDLGARPPPPPPRPSRRSPPAPLTLVDLGLADFYLPGKSYNVRVASRHYKPPELLIGHDRYDYAVDVWSAGCILAGLLFRKEPFFRGKDNEDQLGKIVDVLGTRDFLPYVRRCGVRLSSGARAAIGRYCSRDADPSSSAPSSSGTSSSSSSSDEGPTTYPPSTEVGRRRRPWRSFLTPSCPAPDPRALDLLDKLLVYDHERRWTAREALDHPFFDEVRERVRGEVRARAADEAARREEEEGRRRRR